MPATVLPGYLYVATLPFWELQPCPGRKAAAGQGMGRRLPCLRPARLVKASNLHLRGVATRKRFVFSQAPAPKPDGFSSSGRPVHRTPHLTVLQLRSIGTSHPTARRTVHELPHGREVRIGLFQVMLVRGAFKDRQLRPRHQSRALQPIYSLPIRKSHIFQFSVLSGAR
jgi:hypothetical protein